ncbi:hypothetical protein, partial [Lysinibacillus sp. GbtcB16]|uniref:hypothetical protein n=1 Tax=Lysinibacillus sp. GbtcB16 TaxID=2824761 RepID=UPI001C30BACE
GIAVDRIYLTKSTENPPSEEGWVVSERELQNPDSIYEKKLATAIKVAEDKLEQAPVPAGTEIGS